MVVMPSAIVVSPPPVPGVVGYEIAKYTRGAGGVVPAAEATAAASPTMLAVAVLVSCIELGESRIFWLVRLVIASVQNPGAEAVGPLLSTMSSAALAVAPAGPPAGMPDMWH